MLKERQIDEYIANAAVFCLYCGEGELKADSDADWGSDDVERKVGCNDCGKQWIEIYQLSEIREIK